MEESANPNPSRYISTSVSHDTANDSSIPLLAKMTPAPRARGARRPPFPSCKFFFSLWFVGRPTFEFTYSQRLSSTSVLKRCLQNQHRFTRLRACRQHSKRTHRALTTTSSHFCLVTSMQRRLDLLDAPTSNLPIFNSSAAPRS